MQTGTQPNLAQRTNNTDDMPIAAKRLIVSMTAAFQRWSDLPVTRNGWEMKVQTSYGSVYTPFRLERKAYSYFVAKDQEAIEEIAAILGLPYPVSLLRN